jgi:hypothetical protein
MDISITPRAYFKALEDLARIWIGRRPHPLGLIPAAHMAAWLTGLVRVG